MAAKKELPPLSDAQMEIMQCVWGLGQATVTDVWQRLKSDRKIARNTVLTVMDRLAKRGWLTKQPLANTHIFKPTVPKKKVLGNVVQKLVDTTFSGSADRLVMALLEGRGISSEEAARIGELIEESKKQRKRKK